MSPFYLHKYLSDILGRIYEIPLIIFYDIIEREEIIRWQKNKYI